MLVKTDSIIDPSPLASTNDLTTMSSIINILVYLVIVRRGFYICFMRIWGFMALSNPTYIRIELGLMLYCHDLNS